MRSPATAIGNPPDFLDVHVHELAWLSAFVTHRSCFRSSDDVAGERVAFVQACNVVSAQDPVGSSGCDTEFRSEPVLAASVFVPGGDDGGFDFGAGLCW